MSQSGPPDWYQAGDIAASLQNVDPTVATDEIVDILQYHEVDAPRERIRELVATTRSRVETDATDETPSPTGDPRPVEPRFVDATDVAQLGTRDAALVLGAVLSRYEGTFRLPADVDDVAVDLFWRRQHTTVGFRTISRPSSQPVEKADVEAVVRGDTSPSTGRTPSVLGIVSNAGFTTNAQTHAETNDIELFGRDHLSQWCRDAKLTPDVLGALLEDSDQSPDEVEEILEGLAPMPAPVRERDPLGEATPSDVTTRDGDGPSAGTVDRRMPVGEDTPVPGTTGELYADPSEDGDFGAFDRFMDELEEDSE